MAKTQFATAYLAEKLKVYFKKSNKTHLYLILLPFSIVLLL